MQARKQVLAFAMRDIGVTQCPLVFMRLASRATRVTRRSGRWSSLVPMFANSSPSSKEGSRPEELKKGVKHKQQFRRQAQFSPARPVRPSIAALRQFETLWLEYRQELQLGKQAATAVLDEVKKGRLPCDAALLRSRARTLLLLDPLQPRLRLRQLLTAVPRAVLAHEPQLLLERAARFAALLPMYDTTHVLTTLLPHLDRDPNVTAMNFLELDDVFGRAFGGAHVPPSAFAHLLRAPGSSVLQPQELQQLQTARETASGAAEVAAAAPPPLAAAVGTLSDRRWTEAGRVSGGEGRPGSDVMQGRKQRLGEHGQPGQRWRDPLAHQRRYVDPLGLLRRLQDMVALFGRETAYVAVQRHPALMDRDPGDLASRLTQIMAAIDPRVTNSGNATACLAGASLTAPSLLPPASMALATGDGGGGGAYGSAVRTGLSRPAGRLLEDAPEALDLEVGEVRRRLEELAAALEWGASQVAQLVNQAPGVLLRDPRVSRENLIRLRLYALRRPSTWQSELGSWLRAGAVAATDSYSIAGSAAAAGASRNAAAAPSQAPSTVNSSSSGWGAGEGREARKGGSSSTARGRGQKKKGMVRSGSGGAGASAAAQVTTTALEKDSEGSSSGGGVSCSSSTTATTKGLDDVQELDPQVLSVVARALVVEEEVIDRFEYLVMSGERPATSLHELLFESRVKFVRQCPRYSRWWAEGAARQRGESDAGFGMGLGLDDGADGQWEEDGEEKWQWDGKKGLVEDGAVEDGALEDEEVGDVGEDSLEKLLDFL